MKKTGLFLSFLLSLLYSAGTLAQSTVAEPKLSVADRMTKARAAKAEKKEARGTAKSDLNAVRSGGSSTTAPPERATTANYRAPVEKKLKGPNGEVVHTGERGAKYYINKNGNKTYLSSNQ